MKRMYYVILDTLQTLHRCRLRLANAYIIELRNIITPY